MTGRANVTTVLSSKAYYFDGRRASSNFLMGLDARHIIELLILSSVCCVSVNCSFNCLHSFLSRIISSVVCCDFVSAFFRLLGCSKYAVCNGVRPTSSTIYGYVHFLTGWLLTIKNPSLSNHRNTSILTSRYRPAPRRSCLITLAYLR